MCALFVERIANRDVESRSRCSTEDLAEKAVQFAQVALSRGPVMARVRSHGWLMRVPQRMCECRLLREQQTHDANELENGALHHCLADSNGKVRKRAGALLLCINKGW